MKNLVKKYALWVAVKAEGKANEKTVLGRILAENPEQKQNIPELQPIIKGIVDEINKLSLDDQKKQLEEIAPDMTTKKKKTYSSDLKELEGAQDGKVVTRVAPSPSGPLHIGHSYIFGLNYEYAKKYGGKMIIRIEDTNPDNIYPDAYELIPKDANWLCNDEIKEVIIQSDRLDLYYDYALRLIQEGCIYIDTDDQKESRNNIAKSIPPSNRDFPPDKQEILWRKMFTEFQPGDAVARFKTSLKDKNPAMRDFPIFRINETEHPKQGKKYRVWPLMNFSVAIDDMDTGVTHAIRGKDHADNAKRQEYIQKALKADPPVAVSVGRINFEGLDISASKTKQAIQDGVYEGWDDIRIPFLLALKRRGYTADAFRKYAREVGLTRNDKRTDEKEFFKAINAFNKEIIDKKGFRFFFISNKKEITIENTPKKEVTLNLHPTNKKGGRNFEINGNFIIEEEDYRQLQDGKVHRLMDCINFTKEKDKLAFHSASYDRFKGNGGKIIHWLPKTDLNKQVEIRMPDNSLMLGVGEQNLDQVSVDDIIQFERFGFCRCDEIGDDIIRFWFAHK